MTNREYLEKNDIAYSKVMAMFNASGFKSFDVWLNAERPEWKFKIGDFLTCKDWGEGEEIHVVIDSDDDYMYVKTLTKHGKFKRHGQLNKNRKYGDDCEVFVITASEQSSFKKIFKN